MERRIETLELPVSELKFGFGNPRKPLTKAKKEELRESLKKHGDFGIVVIDHLNNVIAGNQRVTILKEDSPEAVVLCKRLIGYSENELKAINIKDNVHAGEWDMDMLAKWTSDLAVDLPFHEPQSNPDERKLLDMELIRYEKYDYVVIVCKNEIDYNNLVRTFDIENKKVAITNKRKIKARAVWYDKVQHLIKAQDEK